MKLEELNFKTFAYTEEESEKLQMALFDKGGSWDDAKKIVQHTDKLLILVENGIMTAIPDVETFIAVSHPKAIHYKEALEMINQVEMEEPEFFIYSINKFGFYTDNNGITRNCYEAMCDYYFAGIKYKYSSMWYLTRVIEKEQVAEFVNYTYCTDKKILLPIPEKIRFFNPNYKGE